MHAPTAVRTAGGPAVGTAGGPAVGTVGGARDGRGDGPAPTTGDTAPATSRRPATLGGLATLVAGVMALAGARPAGDNSFLTHLATGRVLLADSLPADNPFLLGGGDFPVPSWWWSGVLAVAEEVGGAGAIRVVTALLAGVLGWLLVRLAAGSRGLVATVLPPTVAALTLLAFLTPRPHLAGFVLLAVALVVWRERRSPWWLVPVLATWVNVHGTWLSGLVVLGLLGAAEVVDGPSGGRGAALRRNAALLGAAVCGVVVGGLCYPERFRLVGLPLEQLGGGPAREVIQAYNEWRPPGSTSVAFWTLVLLGAVAAAGSVRHRRPGAAVVSVLLTLVGLSAQRLVPLAAVALVPLGAAALDGVGTLRAPTGRTARALGAAGVALCVVAGAWSLRSPHLDLDRYPTASVDWLEARGLVGSAAVPLVHQDYVGNYLEWRYGSGVRAYTDDRPGLDRAVDYLDLIWARPGWDRALADVDAQVVLWDDDKPLTRRLARSGDWERVQRADGFSVWCRPGVSACR